MVLMFHGVDRYFRAHLSIRAKLLVLAGRTPLIEKGPVVAGIGTR